MRIIGGKDYYDHGLAYGVDETLIFVRKDNLVKANEFPIEMTGGCPDLEVPGDGRRRPWYARQEDLYEWKHRGWTVRMSSVHVVLCGKYYHGVRAFYHKKEYDPIKLSDWQMDTFWNVETLDKFLRKHGGRVKPNKPSQNRWHPVRNDYIPFDHRNLSDDEKSWVIEHGVTVATSTNENIKNIGDGTGREYRFWNVNSDTLKSVQFIRVMDPVTAFQEIGMWVGGVLPKPGNPVVQITDEAIRQHKAGMDKTSFRRPKENAR